MIRLVHFGKKKKKTKKKIEEYVYVNYGNKVITSGRSSWLP